MKSTTGFVKTDLKEIDLLQQLRHKTKSISDMNSKLKEYTGISDFFLSENEYDEFIKFSESHRYEEFSTNNKEWGDIQTPKLLTDKICSFLKQSGFSPQIVIEPTFGVGNFITSTLDHFGDVKRVYGIEIHQEYEWTFKLSLLRRFLQNKKIKTDILLKRANIFNHIFDLEFFPKDSNILIIGNPPWVTNTDLSSIGSDNMPNKTNFKKFSGMDAMTGKSNFDLGEYIILELLGIFSARKGKLAMLCKNSVIRNIVKHLPDYPYAISNIRAITIDAKEEFAKNVDASLLLLDLGSRTTEFTCSISDIESPSYIQKKFGWVGKQFVSNIGEYIKHGDVDGHSSFTWRGGIKHDCAPVVELTKSGNNLINGLDEEINIEKEMIFPLLKSSELKNFTITQNKHSLIVTQHKVGEKTDYIMQKFPKLWKYLNIKSEFFNKRKSRIYKKDLPFSIFGVGDYTFAPYKVAVSGMYKEPRFSLCLPIDGKPFVFDDTCYFIGFDSYEDALFVCTILNSPTVREFLLSIAFLDAKRPFTKDILSRLDISKLAKKITFNEILAIWKEKQFENKEKLSKANYDRFKSALPI